MRALTLVAALVVLLPSGASAEPRPLSGPYGGLALAGSVAPFGSGSEFEVRCLELGAARCDTPAPLGGGFFGWVGYGRDPLGFEVMFGAFGDVHRPAARFDGTPHLPHGDPLLSTPPRDETFILLRGGGMIAPRLRWSSQSESTRLSLATGVGLAVRYMALEREVTTDGGLEDRPYFSPGTAYWSPGWSLDGSVHIRSTPTLGIVLGLGLWVETAWGDTRAVADPTRSVAGNGKQFPVATPAYAMASGLQAYFLPYVGLAFGP